MRYELDDHVNERPGIQITNKDDRTLTLSVEKKESAHIPPYMTQMRKLLREFRQLWPRGLTNDIATTF